MGMLGDFARAFKEGMNEGQPAPQPRVETVVRQAPQRRYTHVPRLVHECMTRNTIDVRGTKYFPDVVARLPTMRRIELKLLKASKSNVPNGWNFEKGDVAVFTERGEFIGHICKSVFERSGIKTGKHYGFVEPASYDYEEGHGITPEPRVFVFCDYDAILSERQDVIVGWRP